MVETGVRRFMIWTSKNAQERVDQAESWSGYATLAILAGILTEIGLLFVFPHDISACEFWSLVAANLAIGIGLAIEFWCILQSIRANRELKIESDRKLGEALDRAAKTEGDLIEFRKKRRSLIQPNMELIVTKLKTFAGTKFDIGFGAGDGEQANFC